MSSNTIRHIDFFKRLSEEHLKLIEGIAERKTYKANEVLCKEGAPQRAMFIVEKGKLVKKREGKEIGFVSDKEQAGFLHLVSKDPAYATVEAVEDSETFVIDSGKFSQLLESNAEFSKAIVTSLTKQLRNQNNFIRDVLDVAEKNKVRILVYDCKEYWVKFFSSTNKGELGEKKYDYQLDFTKEKLSPKTASYCKNHQVVCTFVNDDLARGTIEALAQEGVKLIALRCAGYDNVDLQACADNSIDVVRVPAYSPYAVAEHAISLAMTLNRKIHRSYNRVKEANFSLEGLVGFDMYGKTAGVVGTGKIGRCLVSILLGFGCKVLCYDIYPAKELQGKEGVTYVSLDELFAKSDVISVHAPLTKETKHMIDEKAFNKMKKGVIFVNTSRGALVDSKALVTALENEIVGAAGLDVYEDEKAYFFEDHSDSPIKDNVLARLTAFNNVIITGHQAFLTQEAVGNIASTTLENIALFLSGKRGADHPNLVKKEY